MNTKRDILWRASMEIGRSNSEKTKCQHIFRYCHENAWKNYSMKSNQKESPHFFLSPTFFFVGIKPLQQWSPWTFLICHLADVSTIVHSKKPDIDVHLRLWAVIEVFVAEGEKLSFIMNVCWNVWQSICGCEYCLIMGKTNWRSSIRRRRPWC
jgi:hypothetical protein